MKKSNENLFQKSYRIPPLHDTTYIIMIKTYTGQGHFGDVYEAMLPDGSMVAVKTLRPGWVMTFWSCCFFLLISINFVAFIFELLLN